MGKILIVGSFMMDLVAKTPRAPIEGETIKGISFSQFTGGKGANQAVAVAKLGGDVVMLGKLGKDSFAEAHIDSLKEYGVDHMHVMKDNDESTGVGFITLEDNGRNRIIIIPGANLKLTPSDIEAHEELIKECSTLILQLEIPLESIYKSIDLAYKYNKTIIFNPAPYMGFDKSYLSKLTYIVLNEVEAKDCTAIEIIDKNNAKKAAEKLLDMGCKNVLITMGEKGVYFLNREEEHFVESLKVQAVDTTAAGDEFIGSFAYGLDRKWSIYHAIKFANVSAALSVTKMGSQPSLPYFHEVKKYIEDNVYELKELVK
ncbi:ribokinase [uncultured Clostridium sp.]|uniref:ribokinase n=1 Tax=uncultured Clostridium sp. TaxID=59620 RepID=UPI0028E8F554|nr:ribokinase [uncultured Clostridium sp.]